MQMPKRKAEEIQNWLIAQLARTLRENPETIGIREPFKDFGLSSVQATRLSGELEIWMGARFSPTLLFEYPTIEALSRCLASDETLSKPEPETAANLNSRRDPIAIIGMACRLPGANDPDEFWQLLREGRDAITEIPPDRWNKYDLFDSDLATPGKMNTKWGGFLTGIDEFDPYAFGISPREAERMDPQQRILMEVAWKALEDANISPERLAGSLTGVFVGISGNEYGRLQCSDPCLVDAYVSTGNALSIAANRLSYFYDLRGPSVALDTACSSSLVAVHLACQSLRNGEATIALVGAVNLILHPETTIAFAKAGLLAPDGRCKVFDARADGYSRSEGVGVLILKPLARAVADGDCIYAVIRGSAINQDGRTNGLTAPSRQAQEAVLRAACANAGVSPGQVQYVEAHGTGTALGDPIEVAALGVVLAHNRPEGDFCSIGSVKTSIGHLEAAAGIAGLIKVVLSLNHGEIPPNLHFREPNPHIPFDQLPVRVQQTLQPWPMQASKRLAGVSSFGFGGTNAHVVVEEAPIASDSGTARPWQLLTLSAKTESSLEIGAAHLAEYLRANATVKLADVAYSLQMGRGAYPHRRIAICRDPEEGQTILSTKNQAQTFSGIAPRNATPVVFMFPGLGDHYLHMTQEVYKTDPGFKASIDQCFELLRDYTGVDFKKLLYPERSVDSNAVQNATQDSFRRMLGRSDGDRIENARGLNQTSLIQPAMFAIEYSLARLLMRWGVQPQAMIGYSLGEYVAACLSGVFTLEGALYVVAQRAQMIERLPEGAMLAVPLGEEEIGQRLEGWERELSLAAVNTASMCVVSGTVAAIEEFEADLLAEGTACRRIKTRHGFHSKMMEPAMEALQAAVARVSLRAPQIPWISNVTGEWVNGEEVRDPAYWGRHMRETVRFAAGVKELWKAGPGILLEVGPGQTLSSFARQQLANQERGQGVAGRQVLASLGYEEQGESEMAFLLKTLGKLWLAGIEVKWEELYAGERRKKLRLPSYAFDRQKYWFATPERTTKSSASKSGLAKKDDLADWFYLPAWKNTPLQMGEKPGESVSATWLVFLDECSFGKKLIERVEFSVDRVFVKAGENFSRIGTKEFTINPTQASDYRALFAALLEAGKKPRKILHLWSVTADQRQVPEEGKLEWHQALGFYSLIHIAQALAECDIPDEVQINVVANNLFRVLEEDVVLPEKAPLLGAMKVIPQECLNVVCSIIDVALPVESRAQDALAIQIIAELNTEPGNTAIAYRNGVRFVQSFESVPLLDSGRPATLRENGVYLITGGLGRIALLLAEYLAKEVRARLVLTSRSSFPVKAEWKSWVETHGDENEISKKIIRLRAIEHQGGEVQVITADAADELEMHKTLRASVEIFGAIHGIIHAAGNLDPQAFRQINKLQESDCEQHFRPKVRSLYVLDRIATEAKLDFVVLLSSISSLVGGLGFAAYSAANSFLDAFAQARASSLGPKWISINLDTWRTGHNENKLNVGSTVSLLALSPEEGVEAFRRVLSFNTVPQIIISTANLQERLHQWTRNQHARSQGAGPAEKVERPATARKLTNSYIPAGNDIERKIAAIWQATLGIEQIGINDNFFDLGGNSLIGMQVMRDLQRELRVQLPTVTLFEAPTVSAMAKCIVLKTGAKGAAASQLSPSTRKVRTAATSDIAIIAVNGRFPGAQNVSEFWNKLLNGEESVSFFLDQELVASGVDPELVKNPKYVKARPIIADADMFDARFFGYSPREAELTDPQQRLFLECAWEAMELAGYDAESYDGRVGVFAGMSISTYWLGLRAHPEIARSMSFYQAVAGNDKDSLATTVSYKLNLKGPSFAVQTHCSTSLVATHLACQSLLNGECDLALAGGVSVRAPQKAGYIYQPGGQDSPDGHTRTFDSRAKGTVLGDGVGLVVLKRLEDALASGDFIYAVIRGSAINNDGALKVGFAAPSVEGQAEAIKLALEKAGVGAETIRYVEAHGSATELGDPIEVAALSKAFRSSTNEKGFCAIGSVKANVGHLDKAAGVTGLIKASLVLRNKLIPPSSHFENPNPEIDFANSPFYVNKAIEKLERGKTPLRVGVNSLGMGGTNAHVVLEEAPLVLASSDSREWQVLMFSAKTASALEDATANLRDYLETNKDSNLADVAFTLQVGRRSFRYRRAILCHDREDAIAVLQGKDPARILSSSNEISNQIVTFMFPGLTDQYETMARGLYESEIVFRQEIDQCSEILKQYLNLDLRKILYPPQGKNESSRQKGINLRELLKRADQQSSQPCGKLHRTFLAQPAVFAIEYALARLLMSWGIVPQAMIGYSLGEYVAAAISGVFSLPDALRLVATRAQLIDKLPAGAMLAVPMPESDLLPLMSEQLSVAVTVSPRMTVISGNENSIGDLEASLKKKEIPSRRLQTTHAFHSRTMEQACDKFLEVLKTIEFKEPEIAFISNVSGTWIRTEDVTNPTYWVRHMCQTVRFGEGLEELLKERDRVFIEIGPGQNLGSFVKQHPRYNHTKAQSVIGTMRSSFDDQSDQRFLADALRKLWLAGAKIDWYAYHAHERRQRLPLPTYPFERQRYWIDPPSKFDVLDSTKAVSAEQKTLIDKWFYAPVWEKTTSLDIGSQQAKSTNGKTWLIFEDASGLAVALVDHLRHRGETVVTVRPGSRFVADSKGSYVINPRDPADYQLLLKHIERTPDAIFHLWSIGDPSGPDSILESIEEKQVRHFYSLIYLAQALGNRNISTPVDLVMVSSNMQQVTGNEVLAPERGLVTGPCRVIPAEYSNISCRSVDIEIASAISQETTADQLIAEFAERRLSQFIAYRNNERWFQKFTSVLAGSSSENEIPLRESGVYLITGGLGGVGLGIAEHLAISVKAKIALVGRSALPPREQWSAILAREFDDSGEAQKIRKIRSLESAGSQVLVLQADVADQSQMQNAVKEVHARFGAIHGVIHAAGVPGNGLIQLKTSGIADQVFRPKVHGTLVLESVLEGINLDFLALFSSISSITGGGPGQVDYCAANAFLDFYARANHNRHGKTVSIDWCEWQWDAWQQGLLGFTPEFQAFFKNNRERFGLTFEEGFDAFQRSLRLGQAHLVVCTRELDKVLEESRSLTTSNILQRLRSSSSAKPTHFRPALEIAYTPATSEFESKIAGIWQNILGIEEIGIQDNFFDLGGNSLIGLQIMADIKRQLNLEVSPVALYEAPTVSALAKYLSPATADADSCATRPLVRLLDRTQTERGGIAIVGMSGRFPGARNVQELWRNLVKGVESITFFSEEELLTAGVHPDVLKDPSYVKAGAVIDGFDTFDATLFGYSPREAEVMDPQHRLFLECAWEALENAGYDSDQYEGSIGVFAGSNISTYLLRLYPDQKTFMPYNTMMMGVAFNSADSLTTKVSYKLNLRGPSVSVQTFCSTSAVAMHMACESLYGGDCDMALAGGVRIAVPQRVGYFYETGAIDSPDGHCRAFDCDGQGAILGNGVAIVVLKRLEDAVRDGDHIYGVIKSSAINNDGSAKVGYTAPSVDIQAEAIATALAKANVKADEISYVEAHGTGTEMGDPIEILALTKAFSQSSQGKQFCPIGSVKTNLGHLDRAAGAVSMIKTALALEHQLIPASLHFNSPNPNIDFANSPFYVNTRLQEWKRTGHPRRAALNALGIGGTNVHFIVEEAPAAVETTGSRRWQLLVLSGKTEKAVEAGLRNMARHLEQEENVDLADVAYTLQVGRKQLGHRRAVVCRDREEAVSLLSGGGNGVVARGWAEGKQRSVVMMLAGVGDQYEGMGKELYEEEEVFREQVDGCCEILQPLLGEDLREVMFGKGGSANHDQDHRYHDHHTVGVNGNRNGNANGNRNGHGNGNGNGNGNGFDLGRMLGREYRKGGGRDGRLNQVGVVQPAVFVMDYALAQLWMSWGIRPQALVGYSLGEYVAACLAGVMSVEDALRVVAERARLIEGLPRGAMLAVNLGEEEVGEWVGRELSLAAVNGPGLTVLSGKVEAVEELERILQGKEIACRRVESSHAMHSPEMEGIGGPLEEMLKGMDLKEPRVPYISNMTGGWIGKEEARDPRYWVRHMCQAVRFWEGLGKLQEMKDAVLLEVGPGQTLGSLARQRGSWNGGNGAVVVASMKSQYDRQSESGYLLNSLGKLWANGVEVDWKRFRGGERRRRVVLPTYAFEQQRYWIEGRKVSVLGEDEGEAQGELERTTEVADWFYVPIWKQSQAGASCGEGRIKEGGKGWLLLLDGSELSTGLKEELERRGEEAVAVYQGKKYVRENSRSYVIDPGDKGHYERLLNDLGQARQTPDRIVHLWSAGPRDAGGRVEEEAKRELRCGFYALLYLVQALGAGAEEEREITIITRGAHKVVGEETLYPERATLVGPCRVIPQEYTYLQCRNIDIIVPETSNDRDSKLLSNLVQELTEGWKEPIIAYRGGHRWVQTFERVRLQPVAERPARIKDKGVYLITGGLRGIGLAIAEHLACSAVARLVLIGRKGLPPRESWQDILANGTDDNLKDSIRHIVAMEKLGAEVLTLSADVSNPEQMKEVIRLTKERFGELNGVIHCAGVPGAGLIQLKTKDAAAAVLAPKVAGTLVLEEVLKNVPVDFIVLISSMTSIVGGGPGQLDYCAANAFLDAYAQARASSQRAIISIDWGEWQWDAWQEGLLGFDPRIAAFFKENRRKFGVSFAEGMDALDRILATRFSNVVVSTREFNAFIRLCKGFTVAGILNEADKRGTAEAAYPRPVLGTSYVAPGSEAEIQIASIWQELLRIEQIGVHDNFFELGGNSLLGIRLIGEMKKRLKVAMAMYVLYEAPTVAAMARFVDSSSMQETSLVERHSRGEMRRKAQERRQSVPR